MAANEGILFNKCSKMLYLCKKNISFPTYLSSISSINHLLDVTLSATSLWFLLPLMTLVAFNGMIAPYKMNELGQFKEKSRKKYFLENILVVMHDMSLILNSI